MDYRDEIKRLLSRREALKQNLTRDDMTELRNIRQRLSDLGYSEPKSAPMTQQEVIVNNHDSQEIVKLEMKNRHHSITKHGQYMGDTVIAIEPYCHAYMVTTLSGEYVVDDPSWQPRYQWEFKRN